MATGTPTPNLGLNVWNGSDKVLRTEENQNFSIIDTFAGSAVKLSNTSPFTANQTAPAWIASGLTGAQGTGRWVGITTQAGAPTSGTFNAGDVVFDPFTPATWTCMSGGTPGTWSANGKTYSAGSGLSLTGTQFANTGVLAISAGTGISITGTNSNLTISGTAQFNPVVSPFI